MIPSFLLNCGQDTYAYTLIKRHTATWKSLEREAIDTSAALIEFRRSTVRDVRQLGLLAYDIGASLGGHLSVSLCLLSHNNLSVIDRSR